MKFKNELIIFFLILIITNSSSARISIQNTSDWQWSKMEVVSDSSTEASSNPSIAVDSQNNIHLVWGDLTDINSAGVDFDIFYRKYDITAKVWGLPEVISTESTGSSRLPVIAIDSEDNVHVVWQDLTDYNSSGADLDIFYKTFDDETQIWSTTTVVSTESTSSSTSSSFTLDSNDNIHIAWVDSTDLESSGTDLDIFYKEYNETSNLWSTTEVVSIESIFNSFTPSIVSDSEDNIHIVYEDSSSIFYKKLDIDSHEWSVADEVNVESTSSASRPSITIDSKDNLHLVYADFSDILGAGLDPDIHYKIFNRTTNVWSVSELISSESTSNSDNPSIVIDSSDKIHVIWQDITNYQGVGQDFDIFYKNKNLFQSSWSELFIVSLTSDQSRSPNFAVDASQQVHAVWNDPTNYNNAGTDLDIFYTKFSGRPQAPVLEYSGPEQNDGIIYLEWDDVYAATSYSIYRDEKPILSIEGLTKIAETTDSFFVDELETVGTFYYAITANGVVGSSELSNTVFVQVELNDGGNVENGGEGFADFPMSIPFILTWISIVVLINRRKEI